jgi:hypothetical protein
MFDSVPPEPDVLRRAGDDTVVAAIEGWARLEAVVSARRLDAIAELTGRRCDKEGERAHWSCDGWDSAAGEVAAALGVNPKKASAQMSLSLTLRHRLPQVATLYLAGNVSFRVVSAISWRTHFVDDDEPLAHIDAALAARAAAWGELSDYKLEQAIDMWVSRHDPDALRRTRPGEPSRDLHVGKKKDDCDTTAVWGRLYASDAAVLDRRLRQLVDGVCEDDPRSIAERRADALGALAAGAERLACRCPNPQCAAGGNDGRAANVVIHVVTEAATAEQISTTGGGLLGRDKIIPTPLLAELIRSGAKVSEVRKPAEAAEPSYVPSAKLAEFVRCRDLTCRFPACEEPAEFCDIDHTIAYPAGPTHPSNLKCLCRKHHLVKTFWTGIDGWADQQLSDGTVVWTAPTGRTYKTLPGSRLFFPTWNTTTAELPKAAAPANIPGRGLMMPKRQRTRTAERAQHIQHERKLNAASAPRGPAKPPNQPNPHPPNTRNAGKSNPAPPPTTTTRHPSEAVPCQHQPLCRSRGSDSGDVPLAGHALELTNAAVIELKS